MHTELFFRVPGLDEDRGNDLHFHDQRCRSGEEDTHTDLGLVHFKEIRSSGSPQMQTGYSATWYIG